MKKFPKPKAEAIIYEDDLVYACLANYPITKGHIVVVWKEEIADLHFMADREYDYLMDTVYVVRNALIKALKVKKVYLIYMDEVKHVHWHLVPRYNEKGYNVFQHKPGKLTDFSLVKKIKENLRA